MSDSPFVHENGLERWLDKPRSQWTADDLVAAFRDGGIRAVSLMHVGGDGWLHDDALGLELTDTSTSADGDVVVRYRVLGRDQR